MSWRPSLAIPILFRPCRSTLKTLPLKEILPGGNIVSTATSITVQRTLTSLLVSASGACNYLSLPATPSGSFPPMVLLLNTSVRAGIDLLRPLIVKR